MTGPQVSEKAPSRAGSSAFLITAAQWRVAIAVVATLVIAFQIVGARQHMYDGEMFHHPADLGDTAIYGIGDTFELVEFTRAGMDCIMDRQWTGCKAAGRFALFQHLPAAVWVAQGYSDGQVMRFLGELNLLSFWSLFIATTVFFGRRRTLESLVFVLVMATSPLLVYARSSFGEVIAMVLTCGYGMAVMTRQPWWVIIGLGCLVGATKDVAAPFVGLLGLAGLGPDLIRRPKHLRMPLLVVIVATMVAVLPTVVFNRFRFGTPVNEVYMAMVAGPSIQTVGSYFLALWVAPNFGMLFFWSTFCAVVGGLAVALWRCHRPWPNGGLDALAVWIPFLASASILLGLSVGLARSGFATTGFSWPPRYLLPWCPPVLIVLLHHYGHLLRRVLVGVGRRPVFIGAVLLIFLGGLPNVAVNFRPHRLSAVSHIPFEPGCPADPDVRSYRECEHFRKWKPHYSTQFEALKVVMGITGERSYVLSVVAYVALVTVLCLEIRRRVTT
jgi:hypothetical protein